MSFWLTFSKLICFAAYTEPVVLWYAICTFPNLPFPSTFPNLNSSAKLFIGLTLLKILGLFGCSWLEMFLFTGVKMLGFCFLWRFLKGMYFVFMIDGENRLFWLWAFLDVLIIVLGKSSWIGLNPVGDFKGSNYGNSYFSLKVCLSRWRSFMLRLCFMRWILLIKIYKNSLNFYSISIDLFELLIISSDPLSSSSSSFFPFSSITLPSFVLLHLFNDNIQFPSGSRLLIFWMIIQIYEV